jgi:hypothetical protein
MRNFFLIIGLVLCAGLVVPAKAESPFSVRIAPDRGSYALGEAPRVILDAGYLRDDFRRVDIFVNDLQTARLSEKKTNLPALLFPPGQYKLRFEAVTQKWARDRVTKEFSVLDPEFSVPGVLGNFHVFSTQKWNDAYVARHGLQPGPYEVYDPKWTGHELFGNVGYWVRAYTVMAKLTGSSYYLDKAGLLVHLMLESTDARRTERGELDIVANPYDEAPDPVFQDRTLAAPGWRNPYTYSDGRTVTRIEALVDGHIAHHIMVYVDAVLSDTRFEAHRTFANGAMERVRQVIDFHDTMWMNDRHKNVPGSYYYSDGKGGKWSPPIVFNHSASLLSAALLIDRHAPTPVYRDRAGRLAGYFLNYAQDQDGSFMWDYDPYTPERNGPAVQDFVHGAMDVDFLVLAREAGVGGLTDEHMRKLAKTFHTRFVKKGSVSFRIDGAEPDPESWVTDSIAVGWLGLAKYDEQVFDTAVGVYAQHKAIPGWERAFLGWAQLMETYVRLNAQ